MKTDETKALEKIAKALEDIVAELRAARRDSAQRAGAGR